MPNEQEPVVLELAPLPREQLGPFLLLGVDKTADKEQIEASWAQRVLWARKNQISLALQDINWAREVLNDPVRRARADAASLNPDTTEGVLGRLIKHYGAADGHGPGWQPIDVEGAPLADYVPATEVPAVREILAAIVVPEVPPEVPLVAQLLQQLVQEPINPWSVDLSTGSNSE